MGDPYCLGGIRAVPEVLWGAWARELAEIDNGTSILSLRQRQIRQLRRYCCPGGCADAHVVIEAFKSAGLQLLRRIIVNKEAGEGEEHHNTINIIK